MNEEVRPSHFILAEYGDEEAERLLVQNGYPMPSKGSGRWVFVAVCSLTIIATILTS